jgi:hypothetical protein
MVKIYSQKLGGNRFSASSLAKADNKPRTKRSRAACRQVRRTAKLHGQRHFFRAYSRYAFGHSLADSGRSIEAFPTEGLKARYKNFIFHKTLPKTIKNFPCHIQNGSGNFS